MMRSTKNKVLATIRWLFTLLMSALLAPSSALADTPLTPFEGNFELCTGLLA